MPRTALPVLVVVWCASGTALRGADDPRALVERALNAMGGPELVKLQFASRAKVKGNIRAGRGELEISFEGEVVAQSDGRMRLTQRIERGERKIEIVTVVDGTRSWRSIDGTVTDFSPDELREVGKYPYREKVTGLTDLLTDKGFTLTVLDEPATVAGLPAIAMKVSSKGQDDMTLYFDKETGLRVKCRYQTKAKGEDRDAWHETTLTDYREVVQGAAEERLLQEAGVRHAGPALLEYLRGQAPDPARLEKARALIKNLAAEAFAAREKATEELIALGPVALPLLREAARDRDLEVSRRAKQCLQQIGEEANRSTVAAAVRLAAVRRPAGAVPALLDLLPGADETVAAEIKAALFALAQGGKPDEALVRALADRDPARRAAAAAALGKDGGAYAKEPRRLYTRLPKMATKGALYVDGKLQVELEWLEFEIFNRFADKEFARP
jgi:hypothetical protein